MTCNATLWCDKLEGKCYPYYLACEKNKTKQNNKTTTTTTCHYRNSDLLPSREMLVIHWGLNKQNTKQAYIQGILITNENTATSWNFHNSKSDSFFARLRHCEHPFHFGSSCYKHSRNSANSQSRERTSTGGREMVPWSIHNFFRWSIETTRIINPPKRFFFTYYLD